MEAMLEHVKGLDSVSPEAASMLIQGVAYLPGWSEKNFQVCVQSTHSARGDCNTWQSLCSQLRVGRQSLD